MFPLFASLLGTLRSSFWTRAAVQFEILALRHQVNVLRRSQRGRVRLSRADRLFWTWLRRFWPAWRSALVVVKPETVMAWHRKGFQLFWTWKSCHRQPGRPELPPDTRELIRRMSLANPLWGAPRIHGELLKLSIEVSQATRGQIHGSSAKTALPNVADFPEQPREAVGLDGLLRGADRHLSSSLCLCRLGAREAVPPPFQRHLPPQLGMGGTTDGRGASLG